MLRADEADLFYDLSETVICRCGEPVVIKKVDDQWFIDYANPMVTELTKEHAKSMHILPAEYYDQHAGRPGLVPGAGLRAPGQLARHEVPVRREVDHRGHLRLHPLSRILSDIALRQRRLGQAGADGTEFFDYVLPGQGRPGPRGQAQRRGPASCWSGSGPTWTTGTRWT